MRELCTANGALLIFDEVMTGFRVARGGAQELLGVRPDLTCFGKVIGGGLPVGAFGGRADIMDHSLAERPGLPGRHAVRQSAGHGGGPRAAKSSRGAGRFRAVGKTRRANRGGDARGAEIGPARLCFLPRRLDVLSLLHRKAGAKSRRREKLGHESVCEILPRAAAKGVYFAPSQFETGFISTAHTAGDIVETARAVGEALREA